jgi:DNA-binding response OmpR family regulator
VTRKELNQSKRLLGAVMQVRTTLGGALVLVAEDEPLIAMDIADAFALAGAMVISCATLEEALAVADHPNLSAAVVDHVLGDGDSSALCQRLKDRNVPFVVYTGLGDLHGACAAGEHVKKPQKPEVLVSMVAELFPPDAASP